MTPLTPSLFHGKICTVDVSPHPMPQIPVAYKRKCELNHIEINGSCDSEKDGL